MEKIVIKWREQKPNISQVYSRGMQYALVSDNNEQIGSLVFCKDFFQDVYSGHYEGQPKEIYHYSYDPAKDPAPSLRRARFLTVNKYDKEFKDKILNALDFLNDFEDKLRLGHTRVYSVENGEAQHGPAFVFEGSKWWISSPVMLSLYTLLMRAGMVHPGGDSKETIEKIVAGTITPYQSNDATQLKSGKKGIDWILECGAKKLFHQPKSNFVGQDIDFMHNSCGIVGFSNKEAKQGFQFWYDRLNKVRKANKEC